MFRLLSPAAQRAPFPFDSAVPRPEGSMPLLLLLLACFCFTFALHCSFVCLWYSTFSFANLTSLACTTYLAPAAWALSLGGTSNLPFCSHRLAYRTFPCCALLPSDFTALCMCSFLLTSFANF
mmetsp:Transcript_17470/g.48259  ORF Transcript_17470/g.48259 Transcript_17470/m.48259 type:complete len:123 (-) Transcript_17470:100-468(-)